MVPGHQDKSGSKLEGNPQKIKEQRISVTEPVQYL